MAEFILNVKRTKHARLIYGRVMSIFLLFTGCEISEQAPSFTVPLTPLPPSPRSPTDHSLSRHGSKQSSCVWSTVIESVPQETRTFVSQARHTPLTSQSKTILSLALLYSHHFSLFTVYRGYPVHGSHLAMSVPPCVSVFTFSVETPQPPPRLPLYRNITRL